MSAVQVFISYSHADKRWFDSSYPHALIPGLERDLRGNQVELWYDRSDEQGLQPGDRFRQLIEEKIDSSQIALLMISEAFFSSEFIRTVELPRIIERADRGEMVLIPILLEPCDWKSYDFVSSRQMLPGEPTPLIDFTASDRQWSHARHHILSGIRNRVRRLNAQPGDSHSVEGPEPPPAGTKTGRERTEVQPPAALPDLMQWLRNLTSHQKRMGILAVAIGAMAIAFVARPASQGGEAAPPGATAGATITSLPAASVFQPTSTVPSATKAAASSGIPTAATKGISLATAQSTGTRPPISSPTPRPSASSTPAAVSGSQHASGATTVAYSGVAEVETEDGQKHRIALDWLTASGKDKGLRLASKRVVSFSDMKSFEIAREADSGYYQAKISLLDGNSVGERLDSMGWTLFGPSEIGMRKFEITKVKRVDFQRSVSPPLLLPLASATTTDGEVIECPADLVRFKYTGTDWGYPYVSENESVSLTSGLSIPFSRMTSLEVEKGKARIATVDGRTLEGEIKYISDPTIHGQSDLGEFDLSLYRVKRIDFHRAAKPLPQGITVAEVTTKDNTVLRAPGNWLIYYDLGLRMGLPLASRDQIPFGEIKSFEVFAGKDRNDFRVTITLWDGQTVTDDLITAYSRTVYLRGLRWPGGSGRTDLPIQSVKRVEFIPVSEPVGEGRMATVTTVSGLEMRSPVDLIEALDTKSSYIGTTIDHSDSLALSTGLKLAFGRIASLEMVGEKRDSAKITLIDGRSVEGKLAFSGWIEGVSEMGPFSQDLSKITRIDVR